MPDRYTRKQTLTNAERFVTPELKDMENKILGARERLAQLEYELYVELRQELLEQHQRIIRTAKEVALLDMILSLAKVAQENQYIRPIIQKEGTLEILGGRHPVVEKVLDEGRFITNDTLLDGKNQRLMMITGPNMAGKSTYMRQVALIVLMAHLGSFVPASKAKIPIVDRIFTRIGASDDLASGQSTFMVEMNEVASIIRGATKKSLLILDEIGRGTSTFDGLSIAWAVAEYVASPTALGAKTLFATHYHELTALEEKLAGVKNYCVQVQEDGQNIVFLHKISPGGANKSYGIAVAQLAGVPKMIIDRAKEIAAYLEDSQVKETSENILAQVEFSSMEDIQKAEEERKKALLLEESLKEIVEIDLDDVTPRGALDILLKLQGQLKDRI